MGMAVTTDWDASTGNLASKNSSNGNTYGYDANGNMTSRHVGSQNFTLTYDAENRLVSVTGAATASFIYDGDGRQVKSVVNGVTTYYVGNHYEKKGTMVTKYYFAGSTRLAVRTGGTLRFLLGDHLGSSSVTTDANGAKTASALYKAFGETRYTLGNLGTDYKFTGQREEASLGIYFFNARWMDPSLGRFTSPDTLVPTGTQGTQAWDRYAYVNNNPVRYTDPTGHQRTDDGGSGGSSCGGEGQPPCGGNGGSGSGSGSGGSSGDDDETDKRCSPSYPECSVMEYGYATQADLAYLQKSVSDAQLKIAAAIALLTMAMADPLNKPLLPAMEKYLAYLGAEEIALQDLGNFLDRAEAVRASSPGGVLAMTVYNGPVDGAAGYGAGYYPRISYQGTYEDGASVSESYIPKSPLTVVFTLLLIGRECHGADACQN